jgi:hypothetical protein
MKALGYVLLALGTVIASLGGAKLPSASIWVSGAGLLLLVIGGVCLRATTRKTADGAALRADDPRALLRRLPERLEELVRTAPGLELDELVTRLGALGAELLLPIGDGSPALLRQLGSQRFASIFGPFAGAERALARAWTAAADGHRPEAEDALSQALGRARESVQALGD